jgi:hypothetical protein
MSPYINRYFNKRKGVSVFLQIVILVIIVLALGVMVYSGASGLMNNWFTNRQINVLGAFTIGSNIIVNAKNAGNIPVTIESIEILDMNGVIIANTSADLPLTLQPGDAAKITLTIDPAATISQGDIVDIYIYIENGEIFKVRLSLQ